MIGPTARSAAQRRPKETAMGSRAITLIVTSLLAWALPTSVVSAARELAIGSGDAGLGQTLEVPITYLGEAATVGLQVDLFFDPTLLSSGTPSAGGALVDHLLSATLVAPGQLRLLIDSPSQAVLGDGVLAILPMTVATDAQPGPTQLVPQAARLGNAAAEALAVSALNAGDLVLWQTSPADLQGELSVAGELFEGGQLLFSLRLSNSGIAAQQDNPTDELQLLLPAGLALRSAVASAGTLDLALEAGSLRWNGSVASGSTVAITLVAEVEPGTGGSQLSAQGAIFYDADGQHLSNEATRLTDDPALAGAADPTGFTVGESIFVRSVVPLGAEAGEELLAGEQTSAAIHGLRVTFSEPMYDPAGDFDLLDVTAPDNYRLLSAGPDGVLQTAPGCAVPLAADDRQLDIDTVVYEAAANTALVSFHQGYVLPLAGYRFTVCETLEDLIGNRLDGDHDGSPGDPFDLAFEVRGANLLRNPSFSASLDWWLSEPSDDAVIAHSPEDLDLAGESGSVLFSSLLPTAHLSMISQCVRLTDGRPYRAGGWARISSSSNTSPALFAAIEVFTDADCSVPVAMPQLIPFQLGADDGSGQGWRPFTGSVAVAAGLVAARVFYGVESSDGVSYNVHLDGLSFVDVEVVFQDGFESGDLSAWTSSVGN